MKKAMACVAIAKSRLLLPRTFTFKGEEYRYFYHRHNLTWRNERTVEISLAREVLRHYEGKNVLEVGNVMSHYLPVSHDVVDKYEEADRVINQDIVCYEPEKEYHLILCISTLEHVGFDEEPREPEKPSRALRKMKHLLAPGGMLFVTFITGYNPALDEMLTRGELGFTESSIMVRDRYRNTWSEGTTESVPAVSKRKSRPTTLAIGFFDN